MSQKFRKTRERHIKGGARAYQLDADTGGGARAASVDACMVRRRAMTTAETRRRAKNKYGWTRLTMRRSAMLPARATASGRAASNGQVRDVLR
jgi:hypothetical protein